MSESTRHSRFIILSLAVLAISGRSHAEDSEPVDQFGDLSCMVVRGLESLDVDQVIRALSRDVEAVLAAHPRAPLAGLAPVLERRLRAGLLAAGRAEAEVTVSVNRDEVCMQAVVREGPVYRCDEIRVVGADAFPGPDLIERLTEPYPPSKAVRPKFLPGDSQKIVAWLDRDGKEVELKPPPWQTGKPAPLAEGSRKKLQREVRLALEDLGYHLADFQVDVEADRATQSADLVIRFRDAGSPSVVEKIEIVGNAKSSRNAIIHNLDLKAGMRLGRRELTQIDCKLWRSGRFIKQDIDTEAFGGGKCKLRIAVVEPPFAPAIDQPLLREQAALLKAGRWLANPDAWQGDLVLSGATENVKVEAILSPGQGMLGSVRSRSDQPPRCVTFLGGPGIVGFYPAGVDAKLESTPPDVRFYFQLRFALEEKPDDSEKPFTVRFDAGFHSGRKHRDYPLLEATVNVEPSAALAMATTHGAHIEWQGDIMSLTNAAHHVEIDAQTGRLLRFQNRANPESLQIRFAEGAFERRYREVRQATAKRPNAFVSERPVSSLLGFLTREDVLRQLLSPVPEKVIDSKWAEADAERLRLFRRLIELGVLEPVDVLMRSGDDESEEKFKIPSTLDPPNWQAGLALAAVPWADPLFARGSWLWTVWREAALTVAGRGVYTDQEIQTLFYSQETGPVCHLVIALLLERVQPKAAHAFATRGMVLREPEGFRKDVSPLVDDYSVTGKVLRRASRILAAMEQQELAQLTAFLPSPWPDCLETLRAELARRDQEAIELALPAALELSWNQGLNQMVLAALEPLRDRPADR